MNRSTKRITPCSKLSGLFETITNTSIMVIRRVCLDNKASSKNLKLKRTAYEGTWDLENSTSKSRGPLSMYYVHRLKYQLLK